MQQNPIKLCFTSEIQHSSLYTRYTLPQRCSKDAGHKETRDTVHSPKLVHHEVGQYLRRCRTLISLAATDKQTNKKNSPPPPHPNNYPPPSPQLPPPKTTTTQQQLAPPPPSKQQQKHPNNNNTKHLKQTWQPAFSNMIQVHKYLKRMQHVHIFRPPPPPPPPPHTHLNVFLLLTFATRSPPLSSSPLPPLRLSPSTDSVAHRPSHTQSLTLPLPLALSRILSISRIHADIPVPLSPFMNWAKTKGDL